MRNKFYQVYDINENVMCNVVIASTCKEAKIIGFGYDATQDSKWVDIRASAIKTGFACWDIETMKPIYEVGKSNKSNYVYTDLSCRQDYIWIDLEKELISQNRYLLVVEND